MIDFSQFYGPNAAYAQDLYERYRQDPHSVDAETRAQFAALEQANGNPPAASPVPAVPLRVATLPAYSPEPPAEDAHTANPSPLDVAHTVGAARLIRYIRELGHLEARIDPLGSPPPGDDGLSLAAHDVTEADLALLPADLIRGPLVAQSSNALTGVQLLRSVYSGSVGYETDHIQVFAERAWLRDAIESRAFYHFDDTRRRDLLERLTETEVFERFLHQTFVGQKRFSLEGCDMLIPLLDSIIRNAATAGTHEVVLGMAHRGRLNVLAHILGKPYAAILGEFLAAGRDAGMSPAGRGAPGWTGDVKYHLGARRAYREHGIEQMPITLAPNPSHLEFVNAVIEGRARAAQEARDRPGMPQQNRKASLAILIHGDAAFPGQGIVAETLNLSNLNGYSTGGTIHIILNNQIGFTTDPHDSRSTLYASDLAKGFEIPIVHVNADQPEDCIAVGRMALAYRETFGKDFLIDLVGYRRWGHNEGDEPTFTQPRMYAQIAAHPTVREQLGRRLEEAGIIAAGEAEALVARVQTRLQQALRQAESQPEIVAPPPLEDRPLSAPPVTAVPVERLHELNDALLSLPAEFGVNPRLERVLQRRRTALREDSSVDWAHAETLAFAAILADGVPIRLTGQDSERGTFSQRHLVLHDAASGTRFVPLQNLPQARAAFAVYNSPLSENAVLGFEYGYSMHAPNTLVLWEAQFGDFANGAQVIIDQFIVSGRSKWAQTPSLVLLLPHGYEGQGPEHSSARLERFLQLCAADNIRVANCTTAAQYFHLLRRQAAMIEYEPRPLVIMTPKSLLRHPRAAASLAELAGGGFRPVLLDEPPNGKNSFISRLILCSGKIYVDLIGKIEPTTTDGLAIARVEQLYPFPEPELRALLARFPALQEIVWLQEEPRNMGAWNYMAPRLRELAPHNVDVAYVGRNESASPSEGVLAQHVVEQNRIITEALYGAVVGNR